MTALALVLVPTDPRQDTPHWLWLLDRTANELLWHARTLDQFLILLYAMFFSRFKIIAFILLC